MFTDRLARLAVDDNFPWIQLLRKTPALAVPYKDRQALLTQIWSQPHVPETDWPENLLRPLGVDLKDPLFWNQGLEMIESLVAQAEQLAAAV
mgnify:CR=1 FL=1